MTPPLRFYDTTPLSGTTPGKVVSLCRALARHRRRRTTVRLASAPFDGAGTGGAG